MSSAVHCEAHANLNNIGFSENVTGSIDEWPHSWPKGEITWRLNNYTHDITREYHQRRAVSASLRAWQIRINHLKFRQERNPDVSVDFDVSFRPLSYFDGRKGVLAHAWYPGQGKISGDVEINDEWNWVTHSKLQTLAKPPLVPILIHEFGHSLGLRHDPREKDSIMYPSFDLGQKKNRLHSRDVTRIQDRYGKRTLPQWLVSSLLNRRDRGFDFR